MDRNGQKETETYRDQQKQAKTDKNQTETDKKKQTKTDRNRQKKEEKTRTETDRNEQIRIVTYGGQPWKKLHV